MKKIIVLLFVLLTSLSLVACGKTTVTNNGEVIDFSQIFVKKTTIRVWIDDEQGDYMQAVIAEFNKLYPNIVVEHQQMGIVDARERLKTFGPSGNGADVFQFPHDHLAQAVLEDLVYALPESTRTLLESRAHPLGLDIATVYYDEVAKSFDPSSPNAVERLYAVPTSVESVGLYYNTDLISTPATTMEQILTEAATWNAQLAADGSGLTNAEKGLYYLNTSSHWADSYFMQGVYSAFGFTPFGPELNDPSAVGFESTAAINALTWIQTSLKPATTGTGAHNSVTGGANFEAGLVPYIITGPWSNEAFQNAGVNYEVAQMPTINGNAMKTFAGAVMAAVYKYSEHKEEAVKFVEFLNSDIAMQLQYEYKTKLPALKTELLSNIPGVSENAKLLQMATQLNTSVPMPTIPQVTYYWGPGETMLINIWNNGIAPSVAAATAEASYRVLAGLSQ